VTALDAFHADRSVQRFERSSAGSGLEHKRSTSARDRSLRPEVVAVADVEPSLGRDEESVPVAMDWCFQQSVDVQTPLRIGRTPSLNTLERERTRARGDAQPLHVGQRIDQSSVMQSRESSPFA